MRAVLTNPNATPRLTIRETLQPIPAPGQVLVRVEAFSLNAGETRTAMEAPGSYVPGSDFAGVVEKAASDDSSPKVGTKVFGFVYLGAWAEYVVVQAGQMAEIPPGLTIAQAAALPVAGVTAMLCLEKAGALIGRRVLITGAAGGVGRFACQLAVISGAKVFGVSRRIGLHKQLKEDGVEPAGVFADMAEARDAGPFDVIFDSVGGDTLSLALRSLARGGVCINCGNSARQLTSFDAIELYRSGGARLLSVWLGTERPEDCKAALVRLANLVAEGRLRAPIDAVLPWTEVEQAAARLIGRGVDGKLVLEVA
jgi:NADPH:quinone reductase-like Zn-dependent oxidoreductase